MMGIDSAFQSILSLGRLALALGKMIFSKAVSCGIFYNLKELLMPSKGISLKMSLQGRLKKMKHSAFFCGVWEDAESLIRTLICFQECGEYQGKVYGKNIKAGGWGHALKSYVLEVT